MSFLNILSTNIRFKNTLDGPFDWDHRKNFLATSVLSFSPDLVASQEGRRPQLEEYERLLFPLQMVSENREWIEDRMYPCIYYRPERFELLDSGDLWLSETPNIAGSLSFESAFPRLCSWTVLKIRNTPFKFLFINTHLNHTKTEIRQKQIKVLLTSLKKMREQLPTIIAGDFNEGPSGEVYRKLKEDWKMIDPWTELNKAEESTHFKMRGEPIKGKRIDWILSSKEFNGEEIELFKKSNEGIYPSDHYPLFLKTSFPL